MVPSTDANGSGTDSLAPGFSASLVSAGNGEPSGAMSLLTRTLYSPGTMPLWPAREPIKVKLPPASERPMPPSPLVPPTGMNWPDITFCLIRSQRSGLRCLIQAYCCAWEQANLNSG